MPSCPRKRRGSSTWSSFWVWVSWKYLVGGPFFSVFLFFFFCFYAQNTWNNKFKSNKSNRDIILYTINMKEFYEKTWKYHILCVSASHNCIVLCIINYLSCIGNIMLDFADDKLNPRDCISGFWPDGLCINWHGVGICSFASCCRWTHSHGSKGKN